VTGTDVLTGEAICLGPLLQTDGPLLFGWLNNAALGRDNGVYRPIDQTKFERWFGSAGDDPSRVVFAIRRKQDMRMVGCLQLTEIDPANGAATLGVMMGADADRGRGFGAEAIRLAAGFAWSELNLQRLALNVTGDNPRALRAYEKAGFEREGVLRRAVYVGGAYQDITVMSLLRPECDQPVRARAQLG
jgi:RimJ/RimL family protein N-acetyltransferase